MAVSISKKDLIKMGIKLPTQNNPKGRLHPKGLIDENDKIQLEFPIKPKPKSRPRTVLNPKDISKAFFSSKGNVETFLKIIKPKTITTKETREFENLVKNTAILLMGKRKPFDVPLSLTIDFYLPGDPHLCPTSIRDGDLDNHLKSLLDSLNEILFEDDRLIVELKTRMLCEDGRGRIIVKAEPFQLG